MNFNFAQIILLTFGMVQAITDPGSSFFRSFAEEWLPLVHKQLLRQFEPLVPPSKAIALQASIKNDLMAPILDVYRQKLQSFNGNQTLSAFDASSAWIEVAEKPWIYWSTNIFPVIIKDTSMYFIYFLITSVKRGFVEQNLAGPPKVSEIYPFPKNYYRQRQANLERRPVRITFGTEQSKRRNGKGRKRLRDRLEPIDILEVDPRNQQAKELGQILFAHRWSNDWRSTLDMLMELEYLKRVLKSASHDMRLNRIQRKLKEMTVFSSIPSTPKSDDSVPSLELSVDSETSNDSRNEIMESSEKIVDVETVDVEKKDLIDTLNVDKNHDLAIFEQISKICYRNCIIINLFFLLVANLNLISKAQTIPLAFIIFAWQGITLSYMAQHVFMNAADIIQGFIHDIKVLLGNKDIFKKNLQLLFLYRERVANKLKALKDKTGRNSASLLKQVNSLFEKGSKNIQIYWENTERELRFVAEECRYFSSSYKLKLEKELNYLMKHGRAEAHSYQEKLLDEFNYLMDLSTQISIFIQDGKEGIKKLVTDGSQKALTYPGKIKDESLETVDYLWRLSRNKIDDGIISSRNHLRLFAHTLGNAAGEGAINQFHKTARKSLKSISNAEAIVYNTAFESAERVGAGMYFGLTRRLLSDIFRVLFLIIPAYIMGTYVYQYVDDRFDFEN